MLSEAGKIKVEYHNKMSKHHLSRYDKIYDENSWRPVFNPAIYFHTIAWILHNGAAELYKLLHDKDYMSRQELYC